MSAIKNHFFKEINSMSEEAYTKYMAMDMISGTKDIDDSDSEYYEEDSEDLFNDELPSWMNLMYY